MDKNFSATIRVTLIYAAFAAAWILFSDRIVESIGTTIQDITLLQTLKGWLFVAITALLLFLLVFRSHQRIEKIYQLDTQTGLLNHYMFKVLLGRKLAECQTGERVLLCYLDIDGFKALNQNVGFEKADQFIVELAHALLNHATQYSALGRFPPDQFAIAKVITDRSQVKSLVLELQELFRRVSEKQGLSATCSIGVAITPEDGMHAKELMEAANVAQRMAKQDRNAVIYHDKSFSEANAKRNAIIKELELALSRQSLTLVYQPKYALDTMKVTGVEVLARWYHPYYGLIPPAEFIPLAEECGLIHRLTLFVVDRAAQELTEHGLLGEWLGHVAINVSASEFNRPTQMKHLLDQLQKNPEFASYVQIEITETATLRDMAQSAEVIAECRRRGVGIAIDDFGTGYTSLAMLKDFTVDELKIDRCFVADLEQQGRSHTIVCAIIAMAKSFKINTVAEGVETETQLKALKQLDCAEAQGFYLGVPMPVEKLKAHLAESDSALMAR